MEQWHVRIAPEVLARSVDHRLDLRIMSEQHRRRWISSAARFLRRSRSQRGMRPVAVVPRAVGIELALHAARTEHPQREPLPELERSEQPLHLRVDTPGTDTAADETPRKRARRGQKSEIRSQKWQSAAVLLTSDY